ncbi:MAG: polysaccharide biosynthesis tyrosine autokinase [Pseudomonadota bacterium]
MEFSSTRHRPDANAASHQTAQRDEDVIDLGSLFSTIWRGKYWIGVITAITILLGGYYAYVVATPLYRSTAVVILETDQQQVVDLQSVVGGLSGDTSEVNSEVEVLRARSLMGKVVDRLDLTNDPEFNHTLQPPTTLDEAKEWVRGMLGLTSEEAVLPEDEAVARTRDAVISRLLDATTVRNVPLSLVFQVTVETESGRKSALIADTIVELYIRNQIEVKFEATEQATIWLSERVAELQVTLEAAETHVSDFSASTDLVSVEGLQALERQLKDLRDRIEVAEMDRADYVARITAINAADTRPELATLADDVQLSNLLDRAQSDESFLDTFDARLTLIKTRLAGDLTRADQQLSAMRSSESDLSADLERQGDDLIRLQQLTREAEATRVLYEYFLTRFNETSAQQGIQQADSRILSDAVIPNSASQPRKSLILAMSGLLGLMLGTGLILLREARNNGFRTAAELEKATGYTVLGQIPRMPVRSRRKLIKYLRDKPMSAAAEAYRNMRTSLMLSHIDNPPKVIVMTSSVPGEGKTTNSIALAQNFLGLGKKVLLIEGDIRRRTLNQYFDNVPARGIVSVMTGEQTLQEAVFRSPGFDADILGGEKTSTNAADLFSSDAFTTLIDEARSAYDAVIIDTPPILVVTDARIIAEQADAVLFSVLWDKTTRPQVEESLRLFHTSGQRVTGLALSQISPKGMKRYGYGSTYGAYAAYGSKYYAN